MKVIILTLVILLTVNICQARTVGCFMGLLDARSSDSFEVIYRNQDILYYKKKSSFLPFIGCGISFDF